VVEESTISNLEPDRLRKILTACKPIYILPRDAIADSVISPAMSVSSQVDIMMGFFSSQSFAEIAPGLAAFLNKSNECLRLIISPYLSETDQRALRDGLFHSSQISDEAIERLIPDKDALANHTLACLAWLISSGRLSVKVALMKDALFHSKVWLFCDGEEHAALHGSANMTGKGLRGNREQLSLARSWMNMDAAETCRELEEEFELLWSGSDAECIVMELSQAIQEKIVQDFKGERQPSEDDFRRLWRRAHGLSEEPVNAADLLAEEGNRRFHVPKWLEYRDGEYSHQGRAIDAWFSSGNRGVLEMCTGSGKTLTALTAAKLLHEKVGPLLIVVSAPYNVLISQWCSEIEMFGLRPLNMTEIGGPSQRSQALLQARRRLKKGVTDCEAVVVSNDMLCTKDFRDQVEQFPGPKMLIADECHNLGAANFITNPPEFFDYRLGLSATPVRQYDAEGTAQLFAYFGEPCFSYTLEEAIGNCLTPYEYHVRFVELSANEMAEWREISDIISRLAWKLESGDKDSYLDSLLLRRRKILETAHSKLDALRSLISEVGPKNLKYTLIYATDKDPEQLNAVNSMLNSQGVFFHQLTAEETSVPGRSRAILERFRTGDLQVLTAKRVLDEGVNVPQIMRAYILASTTVRRQWVQRRGRLLRTCKAIGKEFAVIHDLVALPPSAELRKNLDADAKKIINAELDRVWEFARLSKNAANRDGPFEAVEAMRALVGG
jgi:superfamily II DNA or RNA helicase